MTDDVESEGCKDGMVGVVGGDAETQGVMERLLRAQPLNPFVKLEFEVLSVRTNKDE